MACPVCFGGDDTLMRESLNAGIGVMMGVTSIVLACFAGFVVKLARRAQLAAPLGSSTQSPIVNQNHQRFDNQRSEIND